MVFGIMVTNSIMRNRLFLCYCKLAGDFSCCLPQKIPPAEENAGD